MNPRSPEYPVIQINRAKRRSPRLTLEGIVADYSPLSQELLRSAIVMNSTGG
ncbi:MAG: hypothetical protein J7545_01610 [Roseofilum sp. SBFL]|uniref:hypothetical protein n=1 Tax=unclassified Roseofilum TaxID=2620099 RepID=UPI001B23CB1C|nr:MULTISPECIES: hypothetical protein [unclassified Roseofilum]MBP0014441.1 hypothetical protein [Roseofilum sp. SID3]MBP0023656.1 hypothetical protein [Roseofilum sp. SID2]MBP0038939.1 hypothetical protein [Roseofilum sp. SID1]MBP0040663.1 hypothetical protein [Roseofilum sp. SBFL]